MPILADEQAMASSPDAQVRLSASAGTGKTQVLTARVLRLLLNDVDPEAILCLTFTKAGAAEMADRIHERLGSWVTMEDKDLRKDLFALGEQHLDDSIDDARNLFAKVLDARGSGLRIQTIHSFCQTLLGSFPAEAGLPPGFRAVEGREEEQLAAKALSDMVEGFGREGRAGDLDRFMALAKRLSEDATRAFLRRCASQPEAMEAIGPGTEAKVRRWLTDGIDDIQGYLEARCQDSVCPIDLLRSLAADNQHWNTKTGDKNAEAINTWLSAEPAGRVELLFALSRAWLTAEGEISKRRPKNEGYLENAEEAVAWCLDLLELVRARDIAPIISDALLTGQAYARAYSDAKRAAGVVDFNDLIRSTVRLLQTPGIGEWIRFKLDQSVDHILIDEAQDSNADQWEIVKALADEFFSGNGQKDGRTRTIFKVGDFKQAIFGFQGTNPREFEKATEHFKAQVEAAEKDYQQLSIARSYRSSQPILDVTNAVIEELGAGEFGLKEPPDQHVSALQGFGRVTLLPPVSEVNGDNSEEDEEGWIGEAELGWAKQLAARVKHWTEGGLTLRNADRVVEPQDIMILVRSRGELARLIVSRLYEVGVPVAGIDRLMLGAPIAVQDLLACIRFVLQPEDDLSLACLLVSPLVGWSQDELYSHAKGRKATPLWTHLGDAKPETLKTILNWADRTATYAFLERILSDPAIQGRKKLIARLGEEARDPIEELLNAALQFEEQASPSLQLFLDWFDKGEVEIKRDPAKTENAVRVMTVHGAKGLQAPVVILADATSDPDFKKPQSLEWEPEEGLRIPLFRPRGEDRAGSLQTSALAQDQREAEEHWRLLYVAMTRAEEHLVVGGALKPKQQGQPLGERCWHVRIKKALEILDARADGDSLVYEGGTARKSAGTRPDEIERWSGPLPDWSVQAATAESRPPRPLAPSKTEVSDDESSPPPSEAMRKAAHRGTLLHSLFERLPGVASQDRAVAAERWLATSAGVTDADERRELVKAALSVIDDHRFSAIFGHDALAEAPVAGVVEGRVISGAIDRLLVTDSDIFVVDFKTGRRVPASADATPKHHKAQMAAYAVVLAGVFPGRTIRAALLYTSGPSLIELPSDMLKAHKPGFTDQQQDLADAS